MKGFLIEDDDLEIAMKVIIVGNGSVGKSSMIQRFCRGVFTRDYKKTIGVDFLERVIGIDGHSVRLMLWDTAGQEEFDAITRTYYRGASACVLTCSITDRNSFNALPIWKTKVCRECGDDVPMVLVANKFDLQKQAVVDSADLEEMARSLGITKVFRTSVKEDLNVLSVFTQLATEYLTSYLALDDLKTPELIEEDAFLASIESHGLVRSPEVDKPHHKFHTPVFGHFRTKSPTAHAIALKNNKNKGQKIKCMSSNKNHKEVKSYHQDDKTLLPPPRFLQGPIISKKPLIGQDEEVGLMQGLRFTPPAPRNNLKYRKIGCKDPSQYFFSASGNHYTHWENKPFRLEDPHGEHGHYFRKQKKEFCTIL